MSTLLRYLTCRYTTTSRDILTQSFYDFKDILDAKTIWASNAKTSIRSFGAACWGFPNPLRSHFVWLRVSSKR